jgi:hypothetical protein
MIEILINLLFLSLLSIQAYLQARYDHRRLHTWLTPFTILSVPFIIICFSAIIIASQFGYIHFRIEVILLWQACLFFFWIGSFPALHLFKRIDFKSSWDDSNRSGIGSMILGICAILIMGYDLYINLSEYGSLSVIMLLNKNELILGSGIASYGQVLGMLVLVVYIGTLQKRDVWKIIFSLILVGEIFMISVKGLLILPLIAGILARTLAFRWKLTGAKIFVAATVIFIISVTNYLVRSSASEEVYYQEKNTFVETAGHITDYLLSGPLTLSGNFAAEKTIIDEHDALLVYAPFVNLWNRLTGNYEESLRPEGVLMIDIREGVESNVNTLFGTIYLYRGISETILLAIILGFGTSFLYRSARNIKNIWFLAGTCLIFAGLAVGWFEYYYWHSVFMVTLFLGVVLSAVFPKRSTPN